MSQFPYDEEKLKELTLYIARRCADDPSFGAVKLNKILFFSDFSAYSSRGTPITGTEYRKYEHGPCPARMKFVKESLERSGDAYDWPRPLSPPYKQRRLLADRDGDVALFAAWELLVVDHWIDTLWGLSAADVSDESHRFAGWKHARFGEPIPYCTAFLPDRPLDLTDEDRQWAAMRVAERRAQTAN